MEKSLIFHIMKTIPNKIQILTFRYFTFEIRFAVSYVKKVQHATKLTRSLILHTRLLGGGAMEQFPELTRLPNFNCTSKYFYFVVRSCIVTFNKKKEIFTFFNVRIDIKCGESLFLSTRA